MFFGFKQTYYEAVIFMGHKKVLKEMLYSEFEAMLDGVVGEPEFQNQTCHAVYLKIDMRLNILGAVFFLIDFDTDGNPDRRWNLPLAQLVDTAPMSASLNGKSVGITCRSQCQIPWHQDLLWEPDLSKDSITLKTLAASIKSNRLGLLIDSGNRGRIADGSAAADQDSAQSAVGSDYKKIIDETARCDRENQRLAASIAEHELIVASLKTSHEQASESLREQFAREKEAMLVNYCEAENTYQAVDEKNRHLQDEIKSMRKALEQQRADFEAQLSASVNQQGVDYSALRKQYRTEFQRKLIEQTGDLKNRLEMREIEAQYREDQIKSLKQQLSEVSALSDNSPAHGTSSGQGDREDSVLELEALGMNFVLTLPAVRPLSIPAVDLAVFRAQPIEYVAERLGLEPATYKSWLRYARNPICSELIAEGRGCGCRLEVVRPKEFIPELSNKCSEHQMSIGQKLRAS